MNEEVWRERDTTPSKVEAALRKLLIERYHDEDAFVPARVLNLVVVVDGEFRGEVENDEFNLGPEHGDLVIDLVGIGNAKLEDRDPKGALVPLERASR